MGFIAFLVLGGIAGWIASLIMGTDASQGIFLNIVVGIVGAFLGGFLFSFFGATCVGDFSFYSLLVATIGAVVLLWLVSLVRSTP
jgi:uncharacterized membrane protein YeaQ/YmgE (transglycosylase-associated protein family)